MSWVRIFQVLSLVRFFFKLSDPLAPFQDIHQIEFWDENGDKSLGI